MSHTFKIILPNAKYKDYVLVNGKNPRFVKEKKSKRYIASMKTENSSFILGFDPYHSLLQKGWWWMNMLFFIITIFGIFDSPDRRKFFIEYESVVALNEGENEILVREIRDREKIIGLECINNVEEHINKKNYDPHIKKRKGLLILSKILFGLFFFIAIAASIAIIVALT